MKLFGRLLKVAAFKEDRRKNYAERLRRQHQIEEERRKRFQVWTGDVGLRVF